MSLRLTTVVNNSSGDARVEYIACALLLLAGRLAAQHHASGLPGVRVSPTPCEADAIWDEEAGEHSTPLLAEPQSPARSSECSAPNAGAVGAMRGASLVASSGQEGQQQGRSAEPNFSQVCGEDLGLWGKTRTCTVVHTIGYVPAHHVRSLALHRCSLRP